ncbi:MAG: hypothetical protein AB7V40_11820 [Methyloceanibacter sp.]
MRRIVTLMVVAAAGGLGLGLSSHDAEALPSSVISAPVATPSAIVDVQYYARRPWWRRQGPVVVPREAVETDPNLAEGGLNPPVVAIVPVRPTSCGEFRYWDGDRCVDARYNNPYLGPR